MPMQTGKSEFISKMGAGGRKAAAAHKLDETEYSQFGDLPPGIDGGVARLVDCKFTKIKPGKQNAGEYMFYAAGVVESPVEFQGQHIQGLRTQISEPLFDTPGRTRATQEDHIKAVQNELKKLGADGNDLDIDNFEAVAEALKQASPHFRFRTWKGQATAQYPTPRTNHQWNGLVDYSVNGQVPSAVEDATEEVEESSPASETTVDELVEAANGGDEEAGEELKRLALEAGADETDIEAAESWYAVASLIDSGGKAPEDEEDEDEEEAEEEAVVPAKEQVWNYRPLDPKTKKPVKKAIECEVMAVDKKAKTVELKNLSVPKTRYKGVSWDSLEAID